MRHELWIRNNPIDKNGSKFCTFANRVWKQKKTKQKQKLRNEILLRHQWFCSRWKINIYIYLFEAQLTVFFEAELSIQPAGNFQISQEAANDVPLSAK